MFFLLFFSNTEGIGGQQETSLGDALAIFQEVVNVFQFFRAETINQL
jgi:hypothetical protein